MESMTATQAIQKYMSEGPSGRKVEIAEFKALSPEERAELGRLAAAELGVEIAPPRA